jgi:hypothetical protein
MLIFKFCVEQLFLKFFLFFFSFFVKIKVWIFGNLFFILPGTLAYYCVHKPILDSFQKHGELATWKNWKINNSNDNNKTNEEILTKFQQYNC